MLEGTPTPRLLCLRTVVLSLSRGDVDSDACLDMSVPVLSSSNSSEVRLRALCIGEAKALGGEVAMGASRLGDSSE